MVDSSNTSQIVPSIRFERRIKITFYRLYEPLICTIAYFLILSDISRNQICLGSQKDLDAQLPLKLEFATAYTRACAMGVDKKPVSNIRQISEKALIDFEELTCRQTWNSQQTMCQTAVREIFDSLFVSGRRLETEIRELASVRQGMDILCGDGKCRRKRPKNLWNQQVLALFQNLQIYFRKLLPKEFIMKRAVGSVWTSFCRFCRLMRSVLSPTTNSRSVPVSVRILCSIATILVKLFR